MKNKTMYNTTIEGSRPASTAFAAPAELSQKENSRDIFVIGCGRWGTCIAWYLDKIGHKVTLYGRAGSRNLQQLQETRRNEYLEISDTMALTSSLAGAAAAQIIVISVGAQNLHEVMDELAALDIRGKILVLCMKGIEIETGRRLSQVASDAISPCNRVAVWLGPGHVQEFFRGVPNCMVIDSDDAAVKDELIQSFSGELIRFYYGTDLIGNEIGAAAKNVMGIAAGMLDGLALSSLKGALMARGTNEISRLIVAMGGKASTVYGLCHLGDYEATLFSPHSQNLSYGRCVVTGTPYQKLAEGFYTVKAIRRLAEAHGVELPICEAVYQIIHEKKDPHSILKTLFARSLRNEFLM